MPKNFKVPSIPKLGATPFAAVFAALKDTQVRIRIGLGVLLAANLVAAGFAFHLFDESPQQLASQVQAARQQVVQQVMKLSRSRILASKVDKGREDGTQFISTYMTNRRVTYSTIVSEINDIAKAAGMIPKEKTMGLEAVDGSETIDKMTITCSFEGDYANLLEFVNRVDKSKRFLIIESLTVSPQQNVTGKLLVSFKLNTFVNEETNNL
jgi:Tfp pilus assembly protein PilO